MKLTVIGAGYVGLVTAAVFSDFGHAVSAIQINPLKLSLLRRGEVPFFEPGLSEVITRNMKDGRLTFTDSYKEGVNGAEVVFICVGTPSSDDGSVDLSYVYKASEMLAPFLGKEAVVVVKSTVPPGTAQKVAEIIGQKTKEKFYIASCPEFLREGSALSDSLCPDRIIIGVDCDKAKEVLLELHKHVNGERIVTDVASAQMIKYASNAFLAMKISFANSIARVSDLVGLDVEAVLKGVGTDSRIGKKFLLPGVGYGGSCFPKDVKGLMRFSSDKGFRFGLLEETESLNKDQTAWSIRAITSLLGGKIRGKRVAVLGLAFKPNTDDLREAPSLPIISYLLDKGAVVSCYDPVAMDHAGKLLKKVRFGKDAYDVCKDADILVLVTEWNEFKELTMKRIKKLMKQPLIFDGRNVYDKNHLTELGFTYKGIGK